MEVVNIFLSGAMTGLSLEEQNKWRNQIRDAIIYGDYDLNKTPIFFNPANYYSPATNEHKSEREAMEFDLNHLRKSNLVIAKFDANNSIGMNMELMLAKELRIPVIGLDEYGVKIHPWLNECCTRICSTKYELVSHVVNFYLK